MKSELEIPAQSPNNRIMLLLWCGRPVRTLVTAKLKAKPEGGWLVNPKSKITIALTWPG